MEPINYVGKWVVTRRLPNRLNRNIGKIQCIFVRNQTEKQIYGTEHDREESGCQNHFHLSEVIRIIDEKQLKSEILTSQRIAKNDFKKELLDLEQKYIRIIKSIGEGND